LHANLENHLCHNLLLESNEVMVDKLIEEGRLLRQRIEEHFRSGPDALLPVIQQIMRHANVTTTMNIYVKMVSEDATVAMQTLETNCATTVQQKRLVGATEGSETPMKCEQEVSVSEPYTGILAEREGFEPSVQVLARTTV
jgi:hypothetical protein